MMEEDRGSGGCFRKRRRWWLSPAVWTCVWVALLSGALATLQESNAVQSTTTTTATTAPVTTIAEVAAADTEVEIKLDNQQQQQPQLPYPYQQRGKAESEAASALSPNSIQTSKWSSPELSPLLINGSLSISVSGDTNDNNEEQEQGQEEEESSSPAATVIDSTTPTTTTTTGMTSSTTSSSGETEVTEETSGDGGENEYVDYDASTSSSSSSTTTTDGSTDVEATSTADEEEQTDQTTVTDLRRTINNQSSPSTTTTTRPSTTTTTSTTTAVNETLVTATSTSISTTQTIALTTSTPPPVPLSTTTTSTTAQAQESTTPVSTSTTEAASTSTTTTTQESSSAATTSVAQSTTAEATTEPKPISTTEAAAPPPLPSTRMTTEATTTTTTTTTTAAAETSEATIATAASTISMVTTTTAAVSSSSSTVATSSTSGPGADVPESVVTDSISPTSSSDDVTLLIRIVFKGGWPDVCSQLPFLRKSLANLVNDSEEKKISEKQIVFHHTECSQKVQALALESDVPLSSVLAYAVDESGHFDESLTELIPTLYRNAPFNFPLPIQSFVLVQEADSGSALAVVIVSCIAFVCLVLLAGLLFIMRKRQGRFNYGERCRPVSLDAYSLDSVSAYNSVRRSKAILRASKRSYGNPTFEDSSAIPSHPMNFGNLSVFCNDLSAIAEEFVNIPQVTANIDELPPGAELKNRYANVIPLPETRVTLSTLNDDPFTEYINANYVRGPKNANKYYIACQAPMEDTVCDFWRMIWEQQCKVIIMLTDLVENGVEKCAEYVPPLEVSDCHRLFGDYQITLKKREAKEKYAISTLHVKNLEKNTFREVHHIWYLWPPNGTPSDAAGVIAVLLEARALQRGATGPIVVHCSPGTGRTGAVIALDLGIRQYEITRTVDVPRVVYTIRRDRAGAVQTRGQYAFIYKGLNLYASKLAGGVIEST